MNILHLVTYAVLSGPLPGVVALARAQRAAGHSAYVVHDDWRSNFSPYEELARGYPPLEALALPWPMVLSAQAGPLHALKTMARLRRLSAQGAIDVLHCHQSHDHALGLSLTSRTTLVRTIHARRACMPRLGAQLLWRRTHGLIARSAPIAQAAARLLPLSRRGNVATIAGSIEASRWALGATATDHRRTLRSAWGVPQDAQVLGHVALISRRGQEELLAAFALWVRELMAKGHKPLPHLIFVGRGPQEVALGQAIEHTGLRSRVHTVGYVPAWQLPALYAALDGAFVAKPGNDGAARAGLEAMASGVPVIGVQSAELKMSFGPQTAFVAQDLSPHGLLPALESWLNHPEQRNRNVKAAKHWLQAERTGHREAQATHELYQQARASMSL